MSKCSFSAVLFLGAFMSLSSAFAAVPEAEARATAAAYVEALKQGNVGAMRRLMSGPLLAKRSRTWANGRNVRLLSDSYAQCDFEIDASMAEANGAVVLTVIEADGSYRKRLQLEETNAGIRIVDERVLP